MDEIRDSLLRYESDGIAPGSFLRSVLENDLEMACARADATNRARLFEIMELTVALVPPYHRGDEERVKSHIERKRKQREGGAT